MTTEVNLFVKAHPTVDVPCGGATRAPYAKPAGLAVVDAACVVTASSSGGWAQNIWQPTTAPGEPTSSPAQTVYGSASDQGDGPRARTRGKDLRRQTDAAATMESPRKPQLNCLAAAVRWWSMK